jgi:hypothetical protein
MTIDIENVAEEKGKNIAKIIIEKYGTDPRIEHKSFLASFLDGLLNGGFSRFKVEKEIYARSLHEATSFFLNHGDAKFDDKIIEILQFRLKARLRYPKEVKKMNPEEMFANLIEIYVTDYFDLIL